MINVFTDGGARGNPGLAAIGVYIADENNRRLCAFGKRIGTATNNIAEYRAVVEALSWIALHKKKEIKKSKINFFLDSKLVVSQITGIFKVKNSELRKLLFEVREKEAETKALIRYFYIPREKNKVADRLVNLALDKT